MLSPYILTGELEQSFVQIILIVESTSRSLNVTPQLLMVEDVAMVFVSQGILVMNVFVNLSAYISPLLIINAS